MHVLYHRRVSQEDIARCEERFNKSKMVRGATGLLRYIQQLGSLEWLARGKAAGLTSGAAAAAAAARPATSSRPGGGAPVPVGPALAAAMLHTVCCALLCRFAVRHQVLMLTVTPGGRRCTPSCGT